METNFEARYGSGTEFAQEHKSCEYDFDFGPVPQVREFVIRWASDGEAGEKQITYKTISLGKPFSDEEFRLTAFGIPEPKGADFHASKAGWPWWLKITLGGIVFVGIAALLRRTFNK